MRQKSIKITSKIGIHLRPAGAMCNEAIKYKSKVYFEYGQGKTANAKSVISILASGMKCGDEMTLITDGEDEDIALENVSKALIEILENEVQ